MDINIWVRYTGTLVALGAFVGVAVRAATSVRGEHDRETMTSLLTTPLSSEELLFGKWLGSILSMRWFAVWLLMIWSLAVVCGGLTPIAVPMLTLTCLVYAAATASLGLWFSVVCRTSLRAIIATLLTGFVLGVGHWLPWICCIPLIRGDPGKSGEFVVGLQGAISPPVVLAGWLPMGPRDLHDGWHWLWHPLVLMFLSMGGTSCWAGFAYFMWHVTNARFKKVGGRLDSATPSPYLPTGADRRSRLSEPGRYGAHLDKLRGDRADGRIFEDTDPTG